MVNAIDGNISFIGLGNDQNICFLTQLQCVFLLI